MKFAARKHPTKNTMIKFCLHFLDWFRINFKFYLSIIVFICLYFINQLQIFEFWFVLNSNLSDFWKFTQADHSFWPYFHFQIGLIDEFLLSAFLFLVCSNIKVNFFDQFLYFFSHFLIFVLNSTRFHFFRSVLKSVFFRFEGDCFNAIMK